MIANTDDKLFAWSMHLVGRSQVGLFKRPVRGWARDQYDTIQPLVLKENVLTEFCSDEFEDEHFVGLGYDQADIIEPLKSVIHRTVRDEIYAELKRACANYSKICADQGFASLMVVCGLVEELTGNLFRLSVLGEEVQASASPHIELLNHKKFTAAVSYAVSKIELPLYAQRVML